VDVPLEALSFVPEFQKYLKVVYGLLRPVWVYSLRKVVEVAPVLAGPAVVVYAMQKLLVATRVLAGPAVVVYAMQKVPVATPVLVLLVYVPHNMKYNQLLNKAPETCSIFYK
jgi:hypothetical protein